MSVLLFFLNCRFVLRPQQASSAQIVTPAAASVSITKAPASDLSRICPKQLLMTVISLPTSIRISASIFFRAGSVKIHFTVYLPALALDSFFIGASSLSGSDFRYKKSTSSGRLSVPQMCFKMPISLPEGARLLTACSDRVSRCSSVSHTI